MKRISEKLSSLREEIESAKTEKSELVGAERRDLDRLEQEYKLKDEKEGRTELAKETTKRDLLKTKIQEGYDKLEQEYEW